MTRTYYVYILCNKNKTTLYIGISNDIERRIAEHKSGIFKGFTNKYNLDRLIYFEKYTRIEDAIKREKQLKRWRRTWKNELITKTNPEWNDLSEQWFE